MTLLGWLQIGLMAAAVALLVKPLGFNGAGLRRPAHFLTPCWGRWSACSMAFPASTRKGTGLDRLAIARRHAGLFDRWSSCRCS